jgi:hypothetical protein
MAVELPDVPIVENVFVVIPVDKTVAERPGVHQGGCQQDRGKEHYGRRFAFARGDRDSIRLCPNSFLFHHLKMQYM